MKATDLDAGSNAVIHYSIQDGADQKFAINMETGWISLIEPLSQEEKASYSMRVTAQDQGGLSSAKAATVQVYVARAGDSQPEFSEPNGYSFSVPENSADRNIGRVTASSRSTTTSPNYSIASGDPETRFTINPSSGRIQAVRALDREEQGFYRLQVIARIDAMFAETTVDITITDRNDNGATFPTSSVEADVYENWPIGHVVYYAHADDPDEGENAAVEYSLAPRSSDFFTVEPSSGEVKLARSLEGISQETFSITVVASDGGSRSSANTLQITFHLIDVNNYTPTFDSPSYQVSIIESLPINDRFFHLTANDKDRGPNGEVFYEILSGNAGKEFGIFPDGVLYVAHALDRETQDSFALTIRAQDHGDPPRSATTTMFIHIIDSNDSPPVIKNTTYNMFITEGSPIDSYVGVVMASDPDLGQNSELWYKFDNPSNDFTIDPVTGIIKTLRVFDREKMVEDADQAMFTLVVIATDFGSKPKSASSVVNVEILDINNCSPRFVRDMYEPSLFENADINTQVVKVSATDDDNGQNAEISYSITDGNEDECFIIDASTGQITLAKELDRETLDIYNLIVAATDGGENPLNSTCLVKITVTDYNDNKPIFIQEGINEVHTVPEGTPPGTLVTKVTATDADRGSNGQVSYKIVNGNTNTAFNIDSTTGRIYVAGNLDFEDKVEYRLTVVAEDYGISALSSSATVSINVLDENDHDPVFTSSSIVRQVVENSPVGTIVGTVTADDDDSGKNGQLVYTITDQTPAGLHFNIDNNGKITTAADIDHEFTESFQVTVTATDQGTPPRSAKKVITVKVTDVNDSPPEFVSMSAIAIPEGTAVGERIGQVSAQDPDADANGQVQYALVDRLSTFRLDRNTGELILQESLAGRNRKYDLMVRATDQGSQPKSATNQVTIFTSSSPGDSNGPTFTQTRYKGEILENEPANTQILQVSARYSGSSTANIAYYMTAITSNGINQPRLFQVQPSTGLVSTTRPLDRESSSGEYILDIYAVDQNSASPKTTKTQVRFYQTYNITF